MALIDTGNSPVSGFNNPLSTLGANPYNSPNSGVAASYAGGAANPSNPTAVAPAPPAAPNSIGQGTNYNIPNAGTLGWSVSPIWGPSTSPVSSPTVNAAAPVLGGPSGTTGSGATTPAGGTGSSAPGGAAASTVLGAGNTGPGYSGPSGPGTTASGMSGYNVPNSAVPAGYYNQGLNNVIGGTGTTVAPTFTTYLDQQNAAMNSPFMTPAAWANQTAQFAAGAPPGLPNGYYSWTPAAQYAWNYAQTNPDAPEVQQAGSVQNFINQYQGSQYALNNVAPGSASTVAATGFGSGQQQTPQQANNITGGAAQALGSDGSNGYFNPNTSGANAGTSGSVLGSGATPGNGLTGPNQTTNQSLAPLLQYLQGLIAPSQNGVQTTPLGYTQYTAPQSNNTSGLTTAQILALLSTLGGSNNNTPTQTSYAQL